MALFLYSTEELVAEIRRRPDATGALLATAAALVADLQARPHQLHGPDDVKPAKPAAPSEAMVLRLAQWMAYHDVGPEDLHHWEAADPVWRHDLITSARKAATAMFATEGGQRPQAVPERSDA